MQFNKLALLAQDQGQYGDAEARNQVLALAGNVGECWLIFGVEPLCLNS